jgi:signal transduction histidine kinase
MSIHKENSNSTDELRAEAEEKVAAQAVASVLLSGWDVKRLYQELQIHEIELEMQVEELRQARNNEFAPVGYVTLDRRGDIRNVNFTGSSLMGVERSRLMNRRFGLFVTAETRPVFTDFFEKVFANKAKESCEVGVRNKGEAELLVQIEGVAAASGDECHIVLIDITVRKLAEVALAETKDSLRRYSFRLQDMEEELRKKLAAELHDEIGQALSVLGIELSMIQKMLPPDSPIQLMDKLEDSQVILEMVTNASRELLSELRPPVLDDFGLVAALRWYVDLQGKRANLAVTLIADNEMPRFACEKELAFFRIAQESMTNVLKHATASMVTIELQEIDGFIQLMIHDNGIGFDLSATHTREHGKGWGMIMMNERAKAVGGALHVESTPGKGTRIIARLRRCD